MTSEKSNENGGAGAPPPDPAPLVLVKMTRTLKAKESGPTSADVHPAEVKNYIRGGWTVAK